jgi:hypothetical protein
VRFSDCFAPGPARAAMAARFGRLSHADGSLTLYAGTTSPGKDKENNWLPAPNGHFSLYVRCYWGKQGILDGSWKPTKIVKASSSCNS